MRSDMDQSRTSYGVSATNKESTKASYRLNFSFGGDLKIEKEKGGYQPSLIVNEMPISWSPPQICQLMMSSRKTIVRSSV